MQKSATNIDIVVVAVALLSGFLHPGVTVYYQSLVFIFLCISVPLFAFAYLAYRYSEGHSGRIQGVRKRPAPIIQEAFGTGRAVLVVSCMAAWPMGLYKLGHPTGMVWTLDEMGLTWWMALLQVYAGVVSIDAMTYWKHRLLHTKLFFPFHKHHHSFRDPTPFAGLPWGQ